MFFCISMFKVRIIVQNVQEIRNCWIIPILLSDLFCKGWTYKLQMCLIKQILNNGLECSLNIKKWNCHVYIFQIKAVLNIIFLSILKWVRNIKIVYCKGIVFIFMFVSFSGNTTIMKIRVHLHKIVSRFYILSQVA